MKEKTTGIAALLGTRDTETIKKVFFIINKKNRHKVHLKDSKSFSTFTNIHTWCFCCRLTSVINVVLWELHKTISGIVINRKKTTQSGDYTVLHSAKVQTEGTAACSFEGERN